MSHTENVLVIPETAIAGLNDLDGFSDDRTKYVHPLIMSPELRFMPRDLAEQDERYKQLIPYIVIVCPGSFGPLIYTYSREKSGGEDRLHGKLSIGIGGHVNDTDMKVPQFAFSRGALREFKEEVECAGGYGLLPAGAVYTRLTAVDRVHYGVVLEATVESAESVRSRDDSHSGGGFQTISWLRENRDRLENWSRLYLDAVHPE